ncbi:hydrocarbon-binding protein [Aetokthonos hydrillicola Thurmond2011]|uniref:Hydrocarbon-binding protein n=1 Tax=Aetokthonos hydrillicola Thurmond2011 TaxID=2712845 RepID=A0AAP5I1M1_9CYAN|nr:hydrocarbon-binding protein [Aetokthonos hydrillicola]MBO3462892.1 hydrocarbon-binding protein [Aetokthonos hydrillicola CCALA 1050]MBW4588154.1 hydrocarbon-binding protein [Aetokthonos hydrillicola CCALA 1050]MDR9893468.1 hydrocarbon-binding protein [Aetokthonos hydrillicola Thurmond2011]
MFRPTLGDFSSIICFKAAISGMEDTLGEKTSAIALTTAGRSRGKNLAKELGLTASLSLNDLTYKLNSAVGKEGTRLCIVHKIVKDNDIIKVYTSETLCSSGEPEGSKRKCTYTLGAVWGVLEQSFGKRLQGKHTISVLSGGEYDVFEFTELG